MADGGIRVIVCPLFPLPSAICQGQWTYTAFPNLPQQPSTFISGLQLPLTPPTHIRAQNTRCFQSFGPSLFRTKQKKNPNPLFQSILISFILHEQTSWIWARYQRKAKRYSRLTYSVNRRKLIHSKCLSFVGFLFVCFFFPLNHHFMHAVTRTVGRRTSNIGSPFYASCVSSHYNTLPSFSVPQSPFHHVLTRPLLILCIPRSTHSLLGDC